MWILAYDLYWQKDQSSRARSGEILYTIVRLPLLIPVWIYLFTSLLVFVVFFFFWVAPHSPALSSSYTPWGWWRGAEPVCDYTWTSSGWWRAAGPAETRLSACTHRRREIQIRAWSKTSRNMKTITFYNREAHHKFAHWYAHQNFFFCFCLVLLKMLYTVILAGVPSLIYCHNNQVFNGSTRQTWSSCPFQHKPEVFDE